MSRRPGRRLFRSPSMPSMPERLQRPLLKRPRTSPLTAKPPIKRHRTISAISEHEAEAQSPPASTEGRVGPGWRGPLIMFQSMLSQCLCSINYYN